MTTTLILVDYPLKLFQISLKMLAASGLAWGLSTLGAQKYLEQPLIMTISERTSECKNLQ